MFIDNRPVDISSVRYQLQMRNSSDEETETVFWEGSSVEGSLSTEDCLELLDAFALELAEAYRVASSAHHFVVTRHFVGADAGTAVTVEAA